MLKVLVVDDNADEREALEALVGTWGHEVRAAKTGAEGVSLAASFRPCVILLDLGLPDRHGYDVARTIRQEAGVRRLFFIAITGWTQLADQLRSAASGISHHIAKPANIELLRELLAAYAASEKAVQAHAEADRDESLSN